MRTQRSVRNQNILCKELFKPPDKAVDAIRPAHLDMTDDEIDKAYPTMGKTSRNSLKREAAKERLRKASQEALADENVARP